MNTLELLVRKAQLTEARWRETQHAPLVDEQLRVRIDAFAFTANNITYATFGDAMDYWRFFPTGEDDWGIVPVWGFASVVESLHPGLTVGERLYGYWPMASHAVLQPERLSPSGFRDGSAHRAALHAVYNQYQRCSHDPLYTAESESVQALLRPLFTTSWLIDDFLADNAFFGADTVLLSSASSKTASGTAFQLTRRADIEVVGLTSPGNVAFCESLGCYHRVLSYDQLGKLATGSACVYVDFAGSGELRRDIHVRFANLKHDSVIGNTHIGERAAPGEAVALPGPRPTFFFAPAQIKKRTTEWGAAELSERLAQAWFAYTAKVTDPAAPWLTVQTDHGAEAARAVYAQVLGGHDDPRIGHMLSLSSR